MLDDLNTESMCVCAKTCRRVFFFVVFLAIHSFQQKYVDILYLTVISHKKNVYFCLIPVTFVWHLKPPPHRSHAGHTGIRSAIYGFKSQDQSVPLKTPLS